MFKRTPILIITFCLIALSVTGCSNTMEGAGQDMKDMGDWMQDTF